MMDRYRRVREPANRHSVSIERPIGGRLAILLAAGTLTILWISPNPSRTAEGPNASVARLQVTDSDGKQAVAVVHLGQVGYGSDLRTNLAWTSNSDGLVELQGLPAGKHTLVANPVSVNPTIFQVELPQQSDPIPLRLAPFPKWRAGGSVETLDARVSVQMHGAAAIVSVELTNLTDHPIRLPQLTMTDMDCRVFVPERFQDGILTLLPHSTQVMNLDWARIVNQGVWLSRTEPISEPWPANEPGEGLQYFRLNIGGKGLLPVALPKPERVRSQRGGSPPEPSGSHRELPLGNFGGIPLQDIKPAAPAVASPQGQETEDFQNAEYYLRYRIRVERQDAQGKTTRAAVPLIYLELSNAGDLDLGIELHQSRHRIEVDGVEYERRDQPWAGIDSLPPGGPPISLPFLLSSGWRTKADDATTGLELSKGQHTVRLKLRLFEFYQEDSGRRGIRAQGGRHLTTRPIQVEVGGTRMMRRGVAIENIRRELAVIPRFHAPQVTESLERTVRDHQPASGDYLLSVLGEGDSSAPDPASFVIAKLWDSFSRPQIERYFKASMSYFVRQRPAYPQGIDAGIAVGPRFKPGYKGLPSRTDRKITSKTTTTHFLDGRQIGDPFAYDMHTTISTWFRTGDLAPGRHTFSMVTDCEFQDGNETYAFRIESPEYEFEIVADAADELLAPMDARLDKQVRDAISIVEVRSTSTWGRRGWQPQIRWHDSDTVKGGSLHTPIWEVHQALPVDLCFRSEFQIEDTGISLRGNELVVLAGETQSFYFRLTGHKEISVLREHADSEGYIRARVVLTPSQAIALSDPRVNSYYGGTITSDVVRFRIDHDEIGEMDGEDRDDR